MRTEYTVQQKTNDGRATSVIFYSRSDALKSCKQNGMNGYLKYYGSPRKIKFVFISKKAEREAL